MSTATAESVETVETTPDVQAAVQAWRDCLAETRRIEAEVRRLQFQLVAARRRERLAYERALQAAA